MLKKAGLGIALIVAAYLLFAAARASGISVEQALRHIEETARRALEPDEPSVRWARSPMDDSGHDHSPEELLNEVLAEGQSQPR